MLRFSVLLILNISFFILVMLKYTVLTYNLDVNNVKIFNIPKSSNHKRGSYFGFSTAFYTQGKDSVLLVGAPRANVSAMQNVYEPGTVYHCPINGVCTEWNIDIPETFDGNIKQIKNSMWNGATIAVENKIDPKIVVCGPRLTFDSNQSKYRSIPGICYLIRVQNITTFNVEFEQEIRTFIKSQLMKQLRENIHDIGKREVGFSLHMIYKYKLQTSLLLGCPGAFEEKGHFVLVTDSFNTFQVIHPSEDASDNYFGYAVTAGYYFKKGELWYASSGPRAASMIGQVSLVNHRYINSINYRNEENKRTVNGEQHGEYFGATLSSCDLNSDGKDELIVGAPLWTKDIDEGRIYIFTTSHNGMFEKQTFEGQRSGSRFGSAITCLGDIDYDGYADFAVGAPYEDRTGAIYIFNGNSNGLYKRYSQKIFGKQFGENIRGFGISISEPRDINADKYPDIAIGAYLSEQTVVVTSKPVVMITTELIYTGKEKLLQNSTNFFIQGCTFYGGMNPPEHLGKYVMKVSINNHINKNNHISITNLTNLFYLEIVTFLTIDQMHGRAFYGVERNNYIYKEYELNKNETSCKEYKIHLKKNIQNIIDPLEISVSITLNENLQSKNAQLNKTNSNIFCKSCASINKIQSKTEDSIKLPFAVDCGEDNICTSDVRITLSTDLPLGNRYTIGSKSVIKFIINIHNYGEPAYQTKIYVYIPESIPLESIPPSCIESSHRNNTSELICDIENPLKKNETLILFLDTTKILYDINQIELITNFTMQSEQKYPSNNTYSLIIYFDTDINIEITGKAQDVLYSYFDNEEQQLSSIQFEHFYEVQKSGVSPIEKVILTVSIPTYWKHSTGNIHIINLNKTSGYMNGQQFYCIYSNFTNSKFSMEEEFKPETNFSISLPPMNRSLYLNCSNTNIQCTHLKCALGPFTDFLSAKLSLTLDLYLQNFISTMSERKDIIFFVSNGSANIGQTYITQKYEEKPNSAIVATMFLGSPITEQLASWLIILSITLGIVLLAFLLLGLITLGFFKRKKREELKILTSKINNKDITLNTNLKSEDFDQE
ncbi:integrin alpha-8 isoform X1 [Nomia melanderi]|uniref:integrin alpha-8 isoform X1 n=1 Tax=Nomia melanderi TaxID=2448451 RepID=UPI003FCE6878